MHYFLRGWLYAILLSGVVGAVIEGWNCSSERYDCNAVDMIAIALAYPIYVPFMVVHNCVKIMSSYI